MKDFSYPCQVIIGTDFSGAILTEWVCDCKEYKHPTGKLCRHIIETKLKHREDKDVTS